MVEEGPGQVVVRITGYGLLNIATILLVIVLTRYDAQRAARGEMLSMPLLGIIPESQEVLRASNIGSPVTVSGATSAPGRAYLHAARRLCGEALPMTIPNDRKGLLDKLFGRRAA